MDSQYSFVLAELVDPQDRLTVSITTIEEPPRLIGFESFVKAVLKHEILLHIPDTPEILQSLKPYRPIGLTFHKGHHELPAIDAVIERYQATPPYCGCWVRVQPGFQDEILRKRLNVRVPLKFPVAVFFTAECKDKPLMAESVNLSGGGLRLKSKTGFQIGQTIWLQFTPEADRQPMLVESEVVYSGPSSNLAEQAAGTLVTAARFIGLTRNQEDLLVGICFRHELQARRHLKNK